ncbi:MAG: hypothetical protein AB7D36_10845 [Oscillospiraceae bacterium]
MTIRQQIIDTIDGKPTDNLLFIPRMDLWYKANSRAGTLPDKYRNASLMEIVDDLGVGYHCLLPDFSDFEPPYADLDIGLGVYHLNVNCYETIFHNITRTEERDGKGSLKVTYHTPKGDISTVCVYDERMKRGGITLWVVQEHAVKSEADWEALAYIFENAEIIPRYDRLEKFQAFIGDRAEAVAYAHTQACAMHLLIKDLMPLQDFYCTLLEDEDALVQLGTRIEPYMDRLYDVVSKAPSRLIFSGGNYDAAVTAPILFDRHMLPQIQKRADIAHKMGKFLICHTDGENTGLLNSLVESRMDVADSICPAPMGKIGLAEYLNAFRDKVTIWGGIPSVCMLEEVMDDKAFYAYIDELFEKITDNKRIILSIADTMPPATKFDRVLHILKMAEEFRPIK